MSNEKICPVYSASDNTARECIKEECGWWCDQRNACAVVSASDSDIYASLVLVRHCRRLLVLQKSP